MPMKIFAALILAFWPVIVFGFVMPTKPPTYWLPVRPRQEPPVLHHEEHEHHHHEHDGFHFGWGERDHYRTHAHYVWDGYRWIWVDDED